MGGRLAGRKRRGLESRGDRWLGAFMGDRPPRPTLSSRPLGEMMWPCTPPKGNFIRKLRFKLQVLYVKRDTHFLTTTASFARERARSHRHDVIHDPSHPPHTARDAHRHMVRRAVRGRHTHTHTGRTPPPSTTTLTDVPSLSLSLSKYASPQLCGHKPSPTGSGRRSAVGSARQRRRDARGNHHQRSALAAHPQLLRAI
jgi:hypothetical protein